MTTSAISHEEFQRLQNQLLDLRSANYSLMEESTRYKNEMKNTMSKYESLEKEFHKAMRALDKSRKAKDVELLFAENDALQQKLICQEEQFREQNQALIQELANLVAANEKLEAGLKQFPDYQNKQIIQFNDFATQCDLANEHYENLLGIEREKYLVLHQENSAKKESIEMLKLDIEKIKEELSLEINELQGQLRTLQIEADKVKGLEKIIHENRLTKDALLHEVDELKKELEFKANSFTTELEQLCAQHSRETKHLEATHADEIKQLEIQVELAVAQRVEFEEEAIKSRQEVQDAQEDVRIAERRIQTITADLRRQLRGERRRADKLQERLRDFVADSSNPLLKPELPVDQDNCSVSSWSLMSGQNEGHNVTSSSPFPLTDSPSSGSEKNGVRQDSEQNPDLINENSKLLSRLATMQQEKWRLEERVLHLEEANAAMADEMVKRGKLIQHYCMEGRSTPTKQDMNTSLTSSPGAELLSGGMRKMVSLIRQIGHDSDGEVDVRRLQRMLEETLTKNMHLQEDVERLSQEIVRLSQIVGSSNASPIVHRLSTIGEASLMNPA